MTMISVAELFALRILANGDRLVRLAVGADLDVRQALPLTGAGMRGVRLTRRHVDAELARRQDGRLRRLRGERHGGEEEQGPRHRYTV